MSKPRQVTGKYGSPQWRPADLAALLILALLPRLLFWPSTLVGLDSIGFALGGLGTWSAHPPGYFGICFTSWLINHLVGDIKDSLVLMNLIASLLGIVAVYRLAQWIELSRLWTLLAATSYAFSINMLYNSIVPLSYATEAMFAAFIGWFVYVALRTGSQKWAIAATVTWALSGFFRQTSCFVLAPLIGWMVFRTVPWRLWVVHATAGLVIAWSWMAINSHYMSAALGIRSNDTFAGSVWSTQIMMQSSYDPTSFHSSNEVTWGTGSGFHWPGVELLAWADDKLATHLLPDWREHSPVPPSPTRAFRLILIQIAKIGYFLTLSLPPLILIFPAMWLRARQPCHNKLSSSQVVTPIRWFLVIWILPPLCLFVFGHIGPPGYLLVFLPACVLALAKSCQITDWGGDNTFHSISRPRGLAGLYASLVLAGLSLFLFATPFRSETPQLQMADILALQYSGPSIAQGYSIARSQLAKLPADRMPEWAKFTTDKEIVMWWRKNNPDTPALHSPTCGD